MNYQPINTKPCKKICANCAFFERVKNSKRGICLLLWQLGVIQNTKPIKYTCSKFKELIQ